MRALYLFFIASFLGVAAHGQIITTIAGGGTSGLGDGGPAVDCELNQPYSTAIDASGNIYIADAGNNRIRKVDAAGTVITVTGTGTGGYNGDNIPATAAQLKGPVSVAFDATGNMYIGDDYNNRIRKVDRSGVITTVAGTGTMGHNGDGGPATAAQLNGPHGIAVDASGNIYVADYGNASVRKINSAGIITTIGGINGNPGNNGDGGPATLAKLATPNGITIDASGNIYIGDLSGACVRKINTSGIISRIAGTDTTGFNGDGGIATATDLDEPIGVAVDETGNVYIAEVKYVRRVNSSGVINIIAGNGSGLFAGDGGLATLAGMDPTGVAVDTHGNIYISDFGNNRIRYIRNTVFVPVMNSPEKYLTLFPNPCAGVFTINIPSITKESADVIVTDMAGREIKYFNATTNQNIKIQLEAPNGVYIIKVKTTNDTWIQKLAVSK